MSSESPGADPSRPSPVESLLSERFRLDQEIEKRRREVTILYSDIVGYTRYVHEHGDVAGRMLQEHHLQLFLPRIRRFDGTLVKTVGDAAMIRFDHPGPAVEAACSVLRELQEDNADQPVSERLHLRIGIASGKALVEENDVNGDVVNISSRLCKMADVDGIMASEAAVRRLDNYLAGLCLPEFDMAVRGVDVDVPGLYRVCWDTRIPARHREAEVEVLVLEVSIEGGQLKEFLHTEGASQDTVTQYEYIPWQKRVVEEACIQITQAFKRSNSLQGESSLATLRSAGGTLYDVLLTSRVKEFLEQSKSEYLIVKIQDSLVSIPWELLHDGRDFFCLHYAMGRRVTSRMKVQKVTPHWSLRPQIAVISDPQNRLPAARLEGRELVGRLNASERLKVAMKSGASLEYMRKVLREAEILHFCGHADYVDENPGESGWALSDGKLTGNDIMQMAESHHLLPLMVVANACQSGRSEEWAEHAQAQIYGLASAFLHAGVQHYLGTFWDVLDTQSKEFAVCFYAAILEGQNIGMAVREARHYLRTTVGAQNLIWASYMLYGNPAESVFGVPQLPPKEKTEAEPGESAFPEKQTPQGTIAEDNSAVATRHAGVSRERTPASLRSTKGILALAVLIVCALGFGYWRLQKQPLPQGPAPVLTSDPSDVLRFLQYLSDKKRDQGVVDEWTSRPLTLAVLPIEADGDVEKDSQLLRKALEGLYDRLSEAKSIRLVEREKLDKALAELDIGTFDIADPGARIRLGRLLAARFLAAGSLTGEGPVQMLALRVFDCESSEIIAYARAQGTDTPDNLAAQVAVQVLEELRSSHPLRARITDLTQEGVYLNIGGDVGAESGQVYRVLSEPKDPRFAGLSTEIGRLEIERVGEAASLARTLQKAKEFEEDQKVELLEPGA